MNIFFDYWPSRGFLHHTIESVMIAYSLSFFLLLIFNINNIQPIIAKK